MSDGIKKKKKCFNVSFDMDNIDVLLTAYNIQFPDFNRTLMYQKAVPRMMDMLNTFRLKATFFVLGKCCEYPDNISVIRQLADGGHEIGSHSYSHKENYDIPAQMITEEIIKADKLITNTIGVKPIGYRAPGYQITPMVLKTLENCGYRYDSSLMPTFAVASMWIILFLKTFKWRNRPLLQRFYHLFNSSLPFRIRGTSMVEISCPHFLRILPYYPTFHFAFPFLERLLRFKMRQLEFLTLEGHALDFLDAEEDSLPKELEQFHPGMKMSWQAKVDYYQNLISCFLETHQPVTMAEYVQKNKDSFPERKIFI